MKTSLQWINSHLDRPVTADEAQRLLAEQGFPIESAHAVADDVCIDVEVTSNRSDCLSHVGAAREIAAGSGRTLKRLDCELPPQDTAEVASLTAVVNDCTDLCPVYTARVIRGVKVGPSPAWLVKRLETIGLRSVNNVVDVTNYVLFELGQPLHAFDMSKLAGGRIVVRRAAQGEKFEAIDGSKHALDATMLVIADAQTPVAVAGVMGGLRSEVGPGTTDVLLESARFAPLSVRRTSRKLKLSSDSSYRFERGVDPLGVERASRLAAKLIVELAGGKLAQGVVRVGEPEPARKSVSMRVARCAALLGLPLTPDDMIRLLSPLGLEPRLEKDGVITCSVPTWRGDLEREVDLIEEVGRMHGLSGIEVGTKISIEAKPAQPRVAARQIAGQSLVSHGYFEAMTFSFIRPALGEPFVPAGDQPLVIEDERRKSEPMLRPAIIPSLLICRKSNQDVGNTGVRLFEIAQTWSRQGAKIVERRSLGMIADAEHAQLAVRDLRGAVEEMAERLMGQRSLGIEPASHANFDAAATLTLDGNVIGVMGVLNAATLALFDLQSPIVAAEIDIDRLTALYPPARKVTPLTRFPGIERDLSVIVSDDVTWRQIEAAINEVSPAMMEELRFMTTYRGKPIEKGFKSVSFRMIFRDATGTLRHDQVDPQVSAVVARLKESVRAELRA